MHLPEAHFNNSTLTTLTKLDENCERSNVWCAVTTPHLMGHGLLKERAGSLAVAVRPPKKSLTVLMTLLLQSFGTSSRNASRAMLPKAQKRPSSTMRGVTADSNFDFKFLLVIHIVDKGICV
jgi:hypothetical protein